MSLDQSDKLNNAAAGTPAGGDAAPQRTRPKVWPPVVSGGESQDTFATPSEGATETDPILKGPEPAVFGGVNPDDDETEALNEPLGTPLEEGVRGDELIPEMPQVEWQKLIRSTWFLLTTMILMLVGGTYIVWLMIPTETYVQTTIEFRNYDQLNEEEAPELRREMNARLRTRTIFEDARAILQRKSPDVRPGFLQSTFAFHRIETIEWDRNGRLRLRVDSRDPGNDLARLSAFVEAFHLGMRSRVGDLDALKQKLVSEQAVLVQQMQQDLELKNQIDELLPEAERYADLKEAALAMARYLELADETNPLRLVASENLWRLKEEEAIAREVAIRRDDLLTERMEILNSIKSTQGEIERLERKIEVFVFAAPPDPSLLNVHDTRGFQKAVMRGMWVGIIALFAGIMTTLHILDARAAERQRRERRELLQRQKKPRAIAGS